MVQVDSRVRRYGTVTLVEVVVENDGDRPRQVRIESVLDGPVWPPRTRGQPEAEWEGDALSARLAPAEQRSFGFATPAEPADPPVAVESAPATADDEGEITPAEVVRTLGDPRPPRDAVPESGGHRGAGSSNPESDPRTDELDPRSDETTDGGEPVAADPDPDRDDVGGTDPDRVSATTTARDTATPDPPDERPDDGIDEPLPPAIVAWLATVERRVADGTAADADHAGTEIPDPSVLRRIAVRAGSLADRIERESDRGRQRETQRGESGGRSA